MRLEEKLGFKVELAQTDNGSEFVNDLEQTKKKSRLRNFWRS
jgi:hypothetical protein